MNRKEKELEAFNQCAKILSILNNDSIEKVIHLLSTHYDITSNQKPTIEKDQEKESELLKKQIIKKLKDIPLRNYYCITSENNVWNSGCIAEITTYPVDNVVITTKLLERVANNCPLANEIIENIDLEVSPIVKGNLAIEHHWEYWDIWENVNRIQTQNAGVKWESFKQQIIQKLKKIPPCSYYYMPVDNCAWRCVMYIIPYPVDNVVIVINPKGNVMANGITETIRREISPMIKGELTIEYQLTYRDICANDKCQKFQKINTDVKPLDESTMRKLAKLNRAVKNK